MNSLITWCSWDSWQSWRTLASWDGEYFPRDSRWAYQQKYNEDLLLCIKRKKTNYKTKQTNQPKSAGFGRRRVAYQAGPLVPLALLHLVVLGVLDYPFLLKEKIEDTSVWFKMSKQLSKFQRLIEESCTVYAKLPTGNMGYRLI